MSDSKKSVVGPWFFNITNLRKQGWDSNRIEVYSLAFLYMVTRYLKILNNVVIYTPLDAVKFNLNHKMVALNFKWNGKKHVFNLIKLFLEAKHKINESSKFEILR
jgi:hypothetical protein